MNLDSRGLRVVAPDLFEPFEDPAHGLVGPPRTARRGDEQPPIAERELTGVGESAALWRADGARTARRDTREHDELAPGAHALAIESAVVAQELSDADLVARRDARERLARTHAVHHAAEAGVDADSLAGADAGRGRARGCRGG